MELSKKDRRADKEIADVINNLEDIQVEELNDENDKEIIGLVEKLNYFSKAYYKRVKANIYEILTCLHGRDVHYKEYEKSPPKIGIHLSLLIEETS